MALPLIKEVLPDPISNPSDGLFVKMIGKGDTLSFISEDTAKELDIAYIYSHSGDKTVSPMVGKLKDRDDMVDALASYLYLKYASNWKRINDAYTAEYDPLENYSMEEKEAVKGSDERSSSNERSSSSESKQSSKIVTDTSSDAGQYGFNSFASVPTDTATGQSIVSGDADANKVNVSDSSTSKDSDSGSRSEDRTLTRHGNIGVTTNQQMLQSELDLRKYDFIESIFKDCDRVLTLSIYDIQ